MVELKLLLTYNGVTIGYGGQLTECLEKQSCLHLRATALSKDPSDTKYRDHPCLDCKRGQDRQMEDFVPEPGWGPFCVICGGTLPTKKRGSGDTDSGECRACSVVGKRNGVGSRGNHKPAYWGYQHRVPLRKECASSSFESGVIPINIMAESVYGGRVSRYIREFGEI